MSDPARPSEAPGAAPATPLYSAGRWWGLVAILFALFLARLPGALTSPRFWAEDGVVWFRDQVVFGPAALVHPHAGYLQLAPRLIAAIADLFPVARAPFLYALLALVAASLCCAIFALPRYRSALESDALRAGLCLLAGAAFYVNELLATPTNLQWYLLLAGVLLALVPPSDGTPLRWLMSFLGGLVVSLSNPLLVLVLPILAGWTWMRRRIAAAHLGLAVGLGAEVAIAVFLQPHLRQAAGSLSALARLSDAIVNTLAGIHHRVIATSVLGIGRAARLAEDGARGPVVVALVLFGLALIWLAKRPRPGQCLRVAVAAYLLVSSVSLPLVLRGVGLADLGVFMRGWERFFFLGCCVFAYLVALALQDRVASRRGEGIALAALLALFALGASGNFRGQRPRDPSWAQSAARIERWRAERKAGREPGSLLIPALPEGWAIRFPGGLTNPGFEEGAEGWTAGAGSRIEAITAPVAEGRGALRLQGSGLAYQDFELKGAEALRVSVLARVPCSDAGAGVRLAVDVAGDSHRGAGRAEACDTWQELSTQLPPAPGQSARLHLLCTGCRGEIFWDEVRVAAAR